MGYRIAMQVKIRKKIVREFLFSPDEFTLPEPDGLHPRILKESPDVVLKSLNKIFRSSWSTREILKDWKKADMLPVFKKRKTNESRKLQASQPDINTWENPRKGNETQDF